VSLSHKRKRFVIEGVTSFKLQVVFGEHGEPLKLVGRYEGSGTDGSPHCCICGIDRGDGLVAGIDVIVAPMGIRKRTQIE